MHLYVSGTCKTSWNLMAELKIEETPSHCKHRLMLEKYVRKIFLKYKVKKNKRASSGIRTKEETSLEQQVKAHGGYLSQTEALEAAVTRFYFSIGRGDLQYKRDRG